MKTADVSIELNGEPVTTHSEEDGTKVSMLPDPAALPESEELPTTKADVADFIPEAPDGGWGWVVMLCSFLNHFIIDGICYAFGTMLPDYERYFQSSSAATGALMSTIIGCYLLSAPFASALVNKYGCRAVGMTGSVIAAASFIISTFSTTIEVMIVAMGVCGGIGFGLMYLPAVVSVSMYFEKKRAIAIGIATCGTGIGTFTFGPVGKYLLQEMDWKSVHFILAGLILQGAVAYALVFPLRSASKLNRKRRQSEEEKIAQKKNELKPTKTRTPPSYTQSARSIGSAHQSGCSSVKLCRSSAYIGGSSRIPTSRTLTVEQAEDIGRPMYKKDVFYSGSIYNLKEFKDAPTVQEYVASITSIPAMDEEEPGRKAICTCLPDTMSDILSEMLDFSLFKSTSFNLIMFSILVLTLAYFIPFAYSTPRAVEFGVGPGKASFIISVLGMSTMIGRLSACLLAQIPRVRALLLHNFCLFGAGLSAMFVPLCQDYLTMCVTAFGYGLFMGGHVSLSPIVLVDVLGLKRLTTSFGLMTLARGVASLAGPPIGGYIFDQTRSYDIGFYMTGSLVIMGMLGYCLLDLPSIKKQEEESNNNK